MQSILQRYLLPGLIFQSLIISGGYSTGRELVEFFMLSGPLRGLSGMLVSMLIWGIVLALTFEFARIHTAYDYRTFFRHLLGKAWVLFECAFMAIAVLALAVIGAASGAIFSEMTSMPQISGTLLMMCIIGILAFYGSGLIEKVLSIWSFVLYAAYISLFILAFKSLSMDLPADIGTDELLKPDLLRSLEYAGINLAAAPAVLFSLRHITKRRESIIAGLLAGIIAITPGLIFYFILLSQYPGVLELEVPLFAILRALELSGFALLFQIVIFGTYIETGIAMVHAVNERLANFRKEKNRDFSQAERVAVALVLLVVSIFLAATFGLVDLIAKGYGTLTYAILALYVLPLFFIGIKKIRQTESTSKVISTCLHII